MTRAPTRHGHAPRARASNARIQPGVLLLALVFAPAALASPASGLWRTPENAGVVEVSDCGAGICGKVVSSQQIVADPGIRDAYNRDPALRTRPIRGVALFDDMRGGPKVWRGRVYNPADGGTYAGTITLVSPDTLRLRGCIVFPLCKSQTWTRLR